MNDYEVCKPDDPYHGKRGELVKMTWNMNALPEGTVRFPDGVERTYAGRELRAVIRIRV